MRAGAPVDAFGIGTQMGVSADAPYVDSVYKLTEYDGEPKLKLSSAKATAPGRKQVWRSAAGDLLTLRDEPGPEAAEPLLAAGYAGWPTARGPARRWTSPASDSGRTSQACPRRLGDSPIPSTSWWRILMPCAR